MTTRRWMSVCAICALACLPHDAKSFAQLPQLEVWRPGDEEQAANRPPALISRPVMFDTPQADAILSKLQVFPANNPWNQVIANWPLHSNSAAMISSIGRDDFQLVSLDSLANELQLRLGHAEPTVLDAANGCSDRAMLENSLGK